VDLGRDLAHRRRQALVTPVGPSRVLDADELLASARDETGLDDFGDETLPRRVAELVDQLDARLSAVHRDRAATVVHGLLVQRLQVLGDRSRFPTALEPVERPIIAFGEGRSGTTLLQMLLGCDPESRLLEFWEVMRPSPPPGVSSVAERQRSGDDDWREILELIPRWLVSHPYNAMLGRNPPECERLWAFDFRALPPTAWWRVPGVHFPAVHLPRDDVRQYEIHRMMLQHLQHGRPARRWVLKGVTHQHRLAALLDAYPDAIFVWIHRDPLQAIASRFELQAQIYEAISGAIDRTAFAATVVQQAVAAFDAAASTPYADDPRIHHLVYETFTADPFAAVRSLYERAAIPFTGPFDLAMREWSAANPSNRFGRFTYEVDALGVDVAALDERLEPYRQRFGVPREKPKEP
jgi:hypothetical protein